MLTPECPVPQGRYDRIILGHGSGGKLSADLLREVILPVLGNETLNRLEDQATCPFPAATGARLSVTTDSFVVNPLFFPGGDIGKLAINGTVNDLVVGGAEPLWLTAAFILEEGLLVADLHRVLVSMRDACLEAGVHIVTGDTKVVDRGNADGLYINTTGLGRVPPGRSLSVSSARPGDQILLSGTLGDHGMAIMSVREGLEFETVLESDSAPLASLTRAMLDACPSIRCMRDPTRGGLASTLNEIAVASSVGIRIDEASIPIRQEVRSACEMLGMDPLFVASEGRLVALVGSDDAEQCLEVMRGTEAGRDSALIGSVEAAHPGTVSARTVVGGCRIVTLLSGEQLPRIC